jgi:small subunit ribosomal protein S4
MGSPRRLRKLFEGPKKVWDAKRIEEEQKYIEDYGLRNMRELWRAQTIMRKIRREARSLLSVADTASQTRSKQLLGRVNSFLIPKSDVTLDDVLALGMRDILERRLQTIVVRKGMCRTFAQSRQLVTHGHVSVEGRKCTSPSQLVTFPQEASVTWFGKPVATGSAPQGKAEEKEESKPEPAAEETKVEAKTEEQPAEVAPAVTA